MLAKYGETPLMLASKIGNMDIINELIEHGAKIDEKNIEGFSPIIIASENGHLNVVKELIKNGANIDAYSKRRRPKFISKWYQRRH